MEDGLVPAETIEEARDKRSLNPCCSGQWSRTYRANVMLRKTVS